MQGKEQALTEYFCVQKPQARGPKDVTLMSITILSSNKSPFHRYGNEGSPKVSDLPKVTQLVGGDELRI